MNDVCSSLALRKRNPLFAGVWKSAGEPLRSTGVAKTLVCLAIQQMLVIAKRTEDPDIIAK